MSDFEEIVNHHTVLEYERDGVILWLTIESDESNHYLIRKIESADGFMVSSPLECDREGAISLKVIMTKFR